jgi:hypothetical protein
MPHSVQGPPPSFDDAEYRFLIRQSCLIVPYFSDLDDLIYPYAECPSDCVLMM